MDPVFRTGLEELSKRRLIFETWPYFHQLGELCDVASRYPDLMIVVDHLGGPAASGPYEGRRHALLAEWRENVAALAAHTNVVMKLGGVGIPMGLEEAVMRELPLSSSRIAEYWGEEVRYCIQTLGASRCMFESNFPVDRKLCDYVTLWNAFKRMTEDMPVTARQLLFEGTARRVSALDAG
jgi:L-fuconolactonase